VSSLYQMQVKLSAKSNFGHYRLLRLARYDLLLVFYSELIGTVGTIVEL